MSHPTLANDPSVSLTAACQTTDPLLKSRASCLDQIGTPVLPNVVLGGRGVNQKVGIVGGVVWIFLCMKALLTSGCWGVG